MASTIGIKIANGEFYSIVEENSDARKRLILTTVHDGQKSMQIDLYKSYVHSMADALYIGSVVVENIKPKPKGDPSVELVITSTAEGEISADATDLDASVKGEHMHLSVSLKSLDEDSRYPELPDFEVEQHEPPPQGLYEKAQVAKEDTKRTVALLPIIGIGLLIVLVCLGLVVFLLRGRSGAKQPETVSPAAEIPVETAIQPAPAKTEPPPGPVEIAPPDEPVIIKAPPPQSEPAAEAAPVKRQRPAPPVASYKVPATIPPGGVPYKIRWGDTLWDISEAFYRNPWLYPRIARFNTIRNPDLIISGTTIRIPPRQ
ncbi:MAG: LysM peptidoglycan-binding domain-containing protein [Spirochaetaceae bacterium]|jgi:LysM repeat protein|nr:LysM peptidoglycan-binding domain-containing protein [Spirochaetaceae bacterium]